MCGIAGITGVEFSQAEGFLAAVGRKLQHRGPDAMGVYSNRQFGVHLLHRRLSVIDKSPAANQPLTSGCGRYIVTYNGEIYNYQTLREALAKPEKGWQTAGDTEVLLEAFAQRGVACLSDVHGMFAFGILDRQEGVLTLARDRVGEKPLFYAVTRGGFVFASELTALLLDSRVDRTLDEQAVRDFMAYGYVPGERTVLQQVRRVLPGQYLQVVLKNNQLTHTRYWSPPNLCYGGETINELTDILRQKLEESIKRQLVADVPVGVLLSGGVDSSVIAAIGSQVAGRKLKTFSVIFPGYEGVDESVHSRRIAAAFDTEHYEIPAADISVDMIDTFVDKCDEPLADQSFFATLLLSEVVAKEVTVALGGDGADEIFGGYPQYQWFEKTALLRRYLPTRLRSCLSRGIGRLLPLAFPRRNGLMACLSDAGEVHRFINTFFDQFQQASILNKSWQGKITTLGRLEDVGPINDAARATSERLRRTDFATFLPGDILTKVDRSAMAASLEVRAPWLDVGVLDFGFGRVPDSMKATASETKLLPKRLIQRLLPFDVDTAGKRGFFVPIDDWMRGAWKTRITEMFGDLNSGIFSIPALQKLLKRQAQGARLGSRLFAVLVFMLWCERNKVCDLANNSNSFPCQ